MTDEEAVELFYVSREVASKMEKFFNATCKPVILKAAIKIAI